MPVRELDDPLDKKYMLLVQCPASPTLLLPSHDMEYMKNTDTHIHTHTHTHTPDARDMKPTPTLHFCFSHCILLVFWDTFLTSKICLNFGKGEDFGEVDRWRGPLWLAHRW